MKGRQTGAALLLSCVCWALVIFLSVPPQNAQAEDRVSSLLNRVGDGMRPLMEYSDPIGLAEKYSGSFTGKADLFLVNWGFSSLVTTKNRKWQTSDEQALLNILEDDSITEVYMDFIPQDLQEELENVFEITLDLLEDEIGDEGKNMGLVLQGINWMNSMDKDILKEELRDNQTKIDLLNLIAARTEDPNLKQACKNCMDTVWTNTINTMKEEIVDALVDLGVDRGSALSLPKTQILQTTLDRFKSQTLNLIGEAAEGLGYAAAILKVKDLLTIVTGATSRTDAYMEIVSYEEIYRGALAAYEEAAQRYMSGNSKDGGTVAALFQMMLVARQKAYGNIPEMIGNSKWKKELKKDKALKSRNNKIQKVTIDTYEKKSKKSSKAYQNIEKMNPVVETYLNFWPQGQHIDTSYNGDVFWNLVWNFAVLDSTGPVGDMGAGTYSYDSIRELSYSLFNDFNGELPAVPDELTAGGGIQLQDNTIRFMLVTPEEQELSLQTYVQNADGGVSAEYMHTWSGYDGASDFYTVEFILNSHYNPDSMYSFPYTIADISYNESNGYENDLSEYIFPDSNTKYLTAEDLLSLDAETLRLGRNEIYARWGRRFKDEGIQAYFDSRSWYNGTVNPDDFDDSGFNEYERANADFISAYENGEIYTSAEQFAAVQDEMSPEESANGIFKDGINPDDFLKDMEGLWECVTYGLDENGNGAPMYTARFTPEGLEYNPDTEDAYVADIVSVSLENGEYRICLTGANGAAYSFLSSEDNSILSFYDNWEGGGNHLFGTSSMIKSQ